VQRKGMAKWPTFFANIGDAKPLGNVSNRSLNVPPYKDEEEVINKVIRDLEGFGLRAMNFPAGECTIAGGSIFAWDEDALSSLLDRNRHTIADDITTEDFVRWVARNNAAFDTPLREVIDEAFGGRWNENTLADTEANRTWLQEILNKGPALRKEHINDIFTPRGDFGIPRP